ncbi:hypothetical protein FQR65_LT20686 [Abscondita terminalis]|nr:hypothetical protein FQR65_LT20686 [Abscondita terminalis]
MQCIRLQISCTCRGSTPRSADLSKTSQGHPPQSPTGARPDRICIWDELAFDTRITRAGTRTPGQVKRRPLLKDASIHFSAAIRPDARGWVVLAAGSNTRIEPTPMAARRPDCTRWVCLRGSIHESEPTCWYSNAEVRAPPIVEWTRLRRVRPDACGWVLSSRASALFAWTRGDAFRPDAMRMGLSWRLRYPYRTRAVLRTPEVKERRPFVALTRGGLWERPQIGGPREMNRADLTGNHTKIASRFTPLQLLPERTRCYRRRSRRPTSRRAGPTAEIEHLAMPFAAMAAPNNHHRVVGLPLAIRIAGCSVQVTDVCGAGVKTRSHIGVAAGLDPRDQTLAMPVAPRGHGRSTIIIGGRAAPFAIRMLGAQLPSKPAIAVAGSRPGLHRGRAGSEPADQTLAMPCFADMPPTPTNHHRRWRCPSRDFGMLGRSCPSDPTLRVAASRPGLHARGGS